MPHTSPPLRIFRALLGTSRIRGELEVALLGAAVPAEAARLEPDASAHEARAEAEERQGQEEKLPQGSAAHAENSADVYLPWALGSVVPPVLRRV
jgi:hypothetical protein